MSTVTSASAATKKRILKSLDRWTGSLPAADRELFGAFVTHTLDRLRGPFLAQHHANQVLQYLETAFRFARVRPADVVKTEVRPGAVKGAVLLTNMPDQPFIVDTLRLFFRDHEADYWGGFNLVFQAERDDEGRLVSVGEGGQHESLCLLEADVGTLLDDLQRSNAEVGERLDLARSMVRDFRAMTRTVERIVEKFEVAADRNPQQGEPWRETAAFLNWLLRENFVFMGMEVLVGEEAAEPLGIQDDRDSKFFASSDGDWPAAHATSNVRVRKSVCESPIHRSGRIDEIVIDLPAQWDDQRLFIRGLFTYRAVTQPSRNVPILRRVLSTILEARESDPASYRYKGIANVFDSLPTEFLFTATEQAIGEMVDLVFEAEQLQDVGVTFLMIGPGSAFCLVAMPKAQFGDELRRLLQEEIVESTDATYADHGVFVGRYDTVLLHYYLTGVQPLEDDALQALSERIRGLATPWTARLWVELTKVYEEPIADRLVDTYGGAFPAGWNRDNDASRTVRDIQLLEGLSEAKYLLADLFENPKGEVLLRLYEQQDVYLTSILPVLDNFGLVVQDGYATEVRSRGGKLSLDTFRVRTDTPEQRAHLLSVGPKLVEALVAVFSDEVDSDPLNRLVVASELTWRQVDVIRAYVRYARQLQVKLAPERAQELLLARPELTGALIGLFEARFDPDLEGDREAAVERADMQVQDHLRRIRAHDEDLLFTTLYDLLQGTLRTNAYRTDRKHHYLSFKFDCSRVPEYGPNPPMYEIYVHNKDVEGVHIRFGPVARGGLRWSDRDDFRTEILGLATTQQKKNVVIVPEGSKGGFYLKRPSTDRSERRQQADEHYQTFIRGLLDITDNAANGHPSRPPRVVCRDGHDPYLVVAADKGTAHLSDTANAISLDYGFWLGDAFASGGSNGYDHKKVGITARGAWVLARRHFAERGIDPYAETFTAAGIGDLGGDVFGNGMTETPHCKLLAAFNHLHIFLDPDPDPARSYEERARLFALGGRQAGWNHYDASLISEGGGVFDRSARAIPLSPPVQAMLGLEVDEASPDTVINAILKMKVDLLWNGGIGTYVKASHETHADADDRSNDSNRVSANELRCAIIGEGGNLGLTQQARIEADRCGVRLNTDAIDNSAGVDMSDHEVNLKILLGAPQGRGDLSEPERNALLESLTEEVAALVLANNDAHGRQISRDTLRSRDDIFQFGRAIAFVEKEFGIKRSALTLPTQAELLERAAAGEGLTRPELAVLGAYVKMYLYRELMAASPKEVPGYREMLHAYFPSVIEERYADDIDHHMLADEIAMTVATTRVIADVGSAMIPVLIETTGASTFEIVVALFRAERLARIGEVRSTLEELRTTVSLSTLYRAWVDVVEGARMVALYWLSARGRVPTQDELDAMVPAVDRVYDLQSQDVIAANRSRLARLSDDDIPEAIAGYVLKAQYLNIALLVWAESRRSGDDLAEVIVRNVAVGRASRLLEIIEDLAGRPATGTWEPIALRILYIRFLQLLRSLVHAIPASLVANATSVDALQPLLEEGAIAGVRSQVDDLLEGEEGQAPTATLLVLEERVSAAIARMQR